MKAGMKVVAWDAQWVACSAVRLDDCWAGLKAAGKVGRSAAQRAVNSAVPLARKVSELAVNLVDQRVGLSVYCSADDWVGEMVGSTAGSSVESSVADWAAY